MWATNANNKAKYKTYHLYTQERGNVAVCGIKLPKDHVLIAEEDLTPMTRCLNCERGKRHGNSALRNYPVKFDSRRIVR